jgi:hypothetical protein
MDGPDIVCIVEGKGEVSAAPVLIRRIARTLNQFPRVHHVRGNRSEITGPAVVGCVRIALSKAADPRILLLFDADDDPACTLGPQCLELLRTLAGHRRAAVVLAVREFENWFIAGIEGLWGKRGIPDGLRPPANLESIRGAKEWISRNMAGGRRYHEPRDQPAFAELFDMERARMLSPSFDKLWREIEKLLS